MNRYKGESSAIAVTNIALIVVGIAGSIIASRALGPSERGLFVSWQVWATTVGILSSCALPQYLVTGKGLSWREAWSSGVMSSIFGAAATVVLLAASGAPVSAIGGAAAIAIANNMSGIRAAWMQRTGQLALHFNAQRAAPQVAGLLALGALVISPERSASVWILWVGATQLAATVLMGILLGARPAWRLPSGALLRRSVYLVPINWLSLLQYRVDLIAMTVFFPPAQVAFYSVALALQGAVVAVGKSVGMRWFSRHEEASATAAVKQTAMLSAGGAILAMVFCWPAIRIAYGVDFMAAVPVALILCVGAVPTSIDYLVTHVAMARGIHSRMIPVKVGIIVLVTILVYTISSLNLSTSFAALGVTIAISIGAIVQVRLVSNVQ